MSTRLTPLAGCLVTVTLALALAALLGCGKQDPSTPGKAGPGDHGAPDGHGGDDEEHAESVLMVRTDPAAVSPGKAVTLHLMVHDATGAMVKDFETFHEKKVHLILVRDGLDTFAHVHPEVAADGSITGSFTFPTAGTYRLYADHKPAGKDPVAAMAEVIVAGTPPTAPALVPDAPGRVTGDALVAVIAVDNAKAGKTTRISFALSDPSGKPVTDLQPYLGAMGHLVVLSADGSHYVHSHPIEGASSAGTVAFEAHFPHAGVYKGWGQFRRADQVRDVPFVVRIE